MPNKKPAPLSAAKLNPQLATQLERLSRTIGAPVDDAAIDRILATVDLADATAILPGVDVAMIDTVTAAAIKRQRWGGEMGRMLSFLKAMVRRRNLSTPQICKKIENLAQALSKAKTALKTEPAYEAAITLAEMAIHDLQEDLKASKHWKNERLVGQFLASQYWTFKRPKKTRARLDRERGRIVEAETVRFIQPVLKELGISYARESIISAMQGANKPTRKR